MNALTRTLSPSAITQLRADHAHVLTSFHQFEAGTPPQTKKVLVNMICRALEMHAQVEEEIFYPAVRAIDSALIDKNIPEHDEMRRLIAGLHAMDPVDPYYDRTFMELMRTVMRHMADEETILFPEAERLMGEALHDLGARMARRRVQLALPLAADITRDTLRALPTSVMFAGTGALITGSYLLRHAFKRYV